MLHPLAAGAQQVGKVPRLALVLSNTPEADIAGPRPKDRAVGAFLEAARELGWVDGHNITIVRKSAEGTPDRYSLLSRELVNLKLDVIVASGAISSSARQATDTIPIVAIGGIALGRGAESLARPGGNVTGLATASFSTILEKRLQLLKEAVPKISRVACLTDIGTTTMPDAAGRAP